MTPTNLITGHIAIKIEMRPGELLKWIGSVNSGRLWDADHCDGLWLCTGGTVEIGKTPEMKFTRFQRPPGVVRDFRQDGTVEDIPTHSVMPHADLIYGIRPSVCKSGVTMSEFRACPWTSVDRMWVSE